MLKLQNYANVQGTESLTVLSGFHLSYDWSAFGIKKLTETHTRSCRGESLLEVVWVMFQGTLTHPLLHFLNE